MVIKALYTNSIKKALTKDIITAEYVDELNIIVTDISTISEGAAIDVDIRNINGLVILDEQYILDGETDVIGDIVQKVKANIE